MEKKQVKKAVLEHWNNVTPTVLVTTIDALGHFQNRTMAAQWEGMGM